MRAVAYIRVSSEEQVSNFSLETQESACKKYCADRSINLVSVFRELGKSAKNIERPELRRMLAFCRRNKNRLDYVVVYDLKRFSRDLVGHYAIRGQLRSLGIGLRSVTESMVDDSKEGAMMEAIIAAMAEYDNTARSERITVGMQAALEAGRWPFPPPIGYLKCEKCLEPDPESAPFVREAFEMMATGLYSQRQICRTLAARGFHGKQGGKIGPQTLRRAAVIEACEGRLIEIQRHNKQLQKRVGELQKQKERLLDLLMDSVIDEETYRSRKERIGADLTVAEIESAEGRIEELDVESSLRRHRCPRWYTSSLTVRTRSRPIFAC